MGVEIERKFLVRSAAWREAVAGPGIAISQGYLAAGGADSPVVRVRLADRAAFLTVKGPGGLVRAEFDYAIPFEDGRALLALCRAGVLAKTRWTVPHGGHAWTVDEFSAPARLAGLVLAEIELPDAEARPALPAWLGAEITDDPRWTNAALAALTAGDGPA
jgi:adenylate cyclase